MATLQIIQAGPHAYLDDVEDFLEHLVPRGGAVHEEALDSLLGLLLRPPLDEGLAYGNLGKEEKKYERWFFNRTTIKEHNCRSATGPDTLYSPQKYQNYSIIIVHLATKFIPQKQFHLHKPILDADLLLTFQSIQS